MLGNWGLGNRVGNLRFWYYDFYRHRYDLSQPILIEIITLLIVVTGVWALTKGETKSRPYECWLLNAGFLAIIGFIGWWWSEVLYDKQVLHSYVALGCHVTLNTPAVK